MFTHPAGPELVAIVVPPVNSLTESAMAAANWTAKLVVTRATRLAN